MNVKRILLVLLYNLLAALLLLGVLFVGLKFWMGSFTHHGEGVDVPDVRNMMFSDASYTLGELRLVPVVVDSAYNKELPAGCILEQTPGVGCRVKEGREIYLTVNNKQVPTLPVPDLADNSSLREAEAKLRALGFKLGPTEYVPGDRDWVMAVKSQGVEVQAGDRVPIDVPIVLVVGNNSSEAGTDDSYEYDSWGSEKEDDGSGDGFPVVEEL